MDVNPSELRGADKFFAIAQERYRILLSKLCDLPKPWSHDPIFQNNRFCNVFREDDKTTIWLRKNIREQLRDDPFEVLAAITAFRWFNKIETGEKLKPFLLGEWDQVKVYNKLSNLKPVVTGAYIIKTPDGMSKLKGVLWCIEQFNKMLFSGCFDKMTCGLASHQEAQAMLQYAPYLGRFMAYQIIADARYTCLLENAPDINTWAQPGPGSTRGIGRIFYNDVDKFKYGSTTDEKEVIHLMKELLDLSRDPNNWPQEWPSWEMQVVQNWCCETDKYYRCEEGGRMKRKFA